MRVCVLVIRRPVRGAESVKREDFGVAESAIPADALVSLLFRQQPRCSIPVFLRPSEWAALEWRDVDRSEGVVRVERAFSYGVLKAPKTKGSRRRVPLPARAASALETLPRRLDTRLVFYGPRGAHIDLRNWRKREWKPALEAAGLARERRPYDLRHSYAAWSLASGIPAHDLSRYMGTSLRMIDLTYGHLVRGSEEAARARLDAFANNAATEAAEGGAR